MGKQEYFQIIVTIVHVHVHCRKNTLFSKKMKKGLGLNSVLHIQNSWISQKDKTELTCKCQSTLTAKQSVMSQYKSLLANGIHHTML